MANTHCEFKGLDASFALDYRASLVYGGKNVKRY